MSIDILIPEVGESISEGVLARWIKRDGEAVKEGEALFELETEKTTAEVPSPASGVLHALVDEGSTVRIGQKAGTIETGASAAKEPRSETTRAMDVKSSLMSPVVGNNVAENNHDEDASSQSEKNGKTTASEAPDERPRANTAAPDSSNSKIPSETIHSKAADASTRISRRVAMTPLRKAAAQRLLQARRNAAHVTTFNEIDMSKVMAVRAQFREEFEREHGVKIGVVSFFVKACCLALKLYPQVNASIDGDAIVYHDFCDIGVAVSTNAGLVVPVIRDADRSHFADIEAAIAALALKAREKRLLPSDLEGGTFTITNGGVFGSLLSTPIPAYPQTAILGLHAIRKRPVVADETIVARPMMYVALSYDHQVIDGREAVGFLVSIKEFVEEPNKLLLEM
jgi:2-oxoglutarate dehydrogenase E2 component (dihydrolipoamide succinyltransferase)